MTSSIIFREIMKYATKQKSTALSQKYRYRINIGKDNIDPPVVQRPPDAPVR